MGFRLLYSIFFFSLSCTAFTFLYFTLAPIFYLTFWSTYPSTPENHFPEVISGFPAGPIGLCKWVDMSTVPISGFCCMIGLLIWVFVFAPFSNLTFMGKFVDVFFFGVEDNWLYTVVGFCSWFQFLTRSFCSAPYILFAAFNFF